MAERRYFGTELAEKMERAEQLQERDIVFTRCDTCDGRFHRGWLTERATQSRIGGGPVYAGWILEPVPQIHSAGGRGRFCVGDETVPLGYVWRLVDEKRDDVVYEANVRATEEYAAALAKRSREPVPAGERN